MPDLLLHVELRLTNGQCRLCVNFRSAISREVRLLCPRKLPRLASAIAAGKGEKATKCSAVNAPLFDHLVGSREQRLRNIEAE